MRHLFPVIAAMLLFLSGCAGSSPEKNTYQSISQQEAKNKMDTQEVLILDVREPSEFAQGHIPHAVLFPVGTITEETAAGTIPDKDTILLVYCRSGNRSKQASEKLVKLGYTNIVEFGGINSWTGETVSGSGQS